MGIFRYKGNPYGFPGGNVYVQVLIQSDARGYRSTRHGCLVTNVARNRLYQRMGYADRGKAVIYGHAYRCFERIL